VSEPTNVVIRVVEPEEFITLGVNNYAFGASPAKPDLEKVRQGLKYLESRTGLAVFADGAPQASASLLAMTENVRGRVLPMGGYGGVASFPQARRQGHVRNMLRYGFELMHEQGMPVSTLYPFRDSFYERLGYAQFPQNRFAVIKPENLAPLLRESLPGEVTQQEIGVAFEEWWGFQERLQSTVHGFSLFARSRAQQWQDDNEDWIALVRENGQVTGAMTFKITGYTKNLEADSFQYTTPAARYQLLAWIARHVDQVKSAVIELGPGEHPETWYRDIYAGSSTEHENAWPSPMGRVISVQGLDGIGAGADDTVAFRLVDDLCPWNGGVWTLTGEGGVLRVTPGGDPSCHLTIQGLSALVWYGEDPATFPLRHWGDPDQSTSARLRALFPPALPLLNEKF
jgi:predicted acetyltransferase